MSEDRTQDILSRIDLVIGQNKRIEWVYIVCSLLLFGVGIACIVVAIITKDYVWSTPSIVTTGLLYKPLAEIKTIRNKNIALATVPILISQLPPEQAAEELQKLIGSLYEEKR